VPRTTFGRWQFTVGDRVKLSLVREIESDDPMHDLFHVHGAGRFVLFDRDGLSEAQSYRRAPRERMMLSFDVLPADAA